VISRGKRYRNVFSILARHGFDDVAQLLSGNRFVRIFKKKYTPEEESQRIRDRWIRFRRVLEDLGPTYIKFGQVISNRPGILPDDLLSELSRLQDAVPPFPFEEVRKILETEFKRPIAEIFSEFNPVPLASASIAQVHEAVLFTGERVAIKVQRPGIEAIIKADIQILNDIAGLMMRSTELSSLRPKEMVAAFESTILGELNFLQEATHFRKFNERFLDDREVKIPKPFPEFCRKNVITLEFLDGIKISDVKTLEEKGYDLKLIAQRGFDAYFKQIFEWGYFHADPHPGNLTILPGNVVGILDFGMVGKLSDRDKNSLVEFIIGLGRDDLSRIVENIEKLQGFEIEDKTGMERDMAVFINDFGGQSSRDIDINDAITRGRELINRHNLKLNPDLFLLLRTVSMLEGIGTTLDPEFRSLEMIKPYALKLLKKNLNPKNLFKSRKLASVAADLFQLITTLPADTRKIIDKVKNDRIRVTVDNKNTRILAQQVNTAAKRLSYALMFVATFGGGCYLMGLPSLNMGNGLNIPAIIAFSLSGLLFFTTFWIRKRKDRF